MITNIPLQAVVRRSFKASPERIFRAWTVASEIAPWFRVKPENPCECLEMDPRVGGNYAIRMLTETGLREVRGEYVEVDPPKRLVFTWLWNGHPEEKKTTVELTFSPTAAGGCDLTLRHTRFPDQNMADQHTKGWTALLETLAEVVDGAA